MGLIAFIIKELKVGIKFLILDELFKGIISEDVIVKIENFKKEHKDIM